MVNRKINITTPLILIVFFLLSVAIRYPNLNRPLSKHHEFVTAVSLRVLQIWHQEGAMKYGLNPVMTYSGAANKNINNHASTTGTMLDEEGNYYYVSHPPFAYILLHVVFRVLGLKPTVLSVQVFHLVIAFISALFIYLIVCLLAQQPPLGKLYPAAFVGFLVYSFNPAVLWFQSNTYMSDMLVHVFFILGVYTMLKLLMRKRFLSPKYLIYFAVILFLMVYTSWLGIFFAFAVLVYSVIKLRDTKVFLPLIFVTLFVTAFGMGLTVYQYSHINGLDAYLVQMANRLGERGSTSGNGVLGFVWVKLMELKIVLVNYAILFAPIFLLLAAFGFLVLTKAKLRIVFTKNGYRFLWISTLPVLLLHLFLLNYSGHNFTALYGTVFLVVLVAILYDKLRTAKVMSNIMLNAGIVLVILLSIANYYYVNRPGDYSWKGDYYASDMAVGLHIKNQVEPDEMVFYTGDFSLSPQLVVYAERNILRVTSIDEAINELKNRGFSSGQLFNVSASGEIVDQLEISVPN